jgi:excinuclease ABC subunit B
MKHAMDETDRRRKLQHGYNVANGITPATVIKAILDLSPTSGTRDYYAVSRGTAAGGPGTTPENVDLADRIEAVRQEMFAAAENLEFEKAARLRDQLRLLKGDADATAAGAGESPTKAAKAGGRGGAKRSAARARRYR